MSVNLNKKIEKHHTKLDEIFKATKQAVEKPSDKKAQKTAIEMKAELKKIHAERIFCIAIRKPSKALSRYTLKTPQRAIDRSL